MKTAWQINTWHDSWRDGPVIEEAFSLSGILKLCSTNNNMWEASPRCDAFVVFVEIMDGQRNMTDRTINSSFTWYEDSEIQHKTPELGV